MGGIGFSISVQGYPQVASQVKLEERVKRWITAEICVAINEDEILEVVASSWS